MKPTFVFAILSLLFTASAQANEPPIHTLQCRLNEGRFVADIVKGENGIFRAKITRYMGGRVSIRFEGPVSFSIGDTADGSTMLMFTSTEAIDPSSERVPEFDLLVKDGVQGELHSSHFLYPQQPVSGPCTITN
jgi:hypothetical protein